MKQSDLHFTGIAVALGWRGQEGSRTCVGDGGGDRRKCPDKAFKKETQQGMGTD